jgi:hypothetical protein
MSPDGGACATRGHVIVLHSAFCPSPPERGTNLHFRLPYVPGQLGFETSVLGQWKDSLSNRGSGVQRRARYWLSSRSRGQGSPI